MDSVFVLFVYLGRRSCLLPTFSGGAGEGGGGTGGGQAARKVGLLVFQLLLLLPRLRAVTVEVCTIRSPSQSLALAQVEARLGEVVARLERGELEGAAGECEGLLAACGGGEGGGGAADHKFEAMLLGCSAGDQREVRGRLHSLVGIVRARREGGEQE